MRSETVDRLSKNIIFVKCYEPFDYTRNFGQLALEITYTDGDKDVLTTKTTKDNVRASFNFNDEAEFYSFIEFLEDKKIPRKW